MNAITPQSEPIKFGNENLIWHRWHPADQAFKGALFLLHGQGDYGLRYQQVAEAFLNAGIAFATCDLPGHGLSSGKRGHIPSPDLVKQVARHGLEEARALVPGKPVGLGGHSAGGLLALHLLGELEEQPDFSWISSPLLRPRVGQSDWKYQMLRTLSYLLPQLTVSTGVSGDHCRITPPEQPSHSDQFHSRISLQWGRQLIAMARTVRNHLERLPKDLPLLLTQGGSDPICPVSFSQDLASKLTQVNLQFQIYPNARHEPFADTDQDEVLADLSAWLSQMTDSQTSSPSN